MKKEVNIQHIVHHHQIQENKNNIYLNLNKIIRNQNLNQYHVLNLNLIQNLLRSLIIKILIRITVIIILKLIIIRINQISYHNFNNI